METTPCARIREWLADKAQAEAPSAELAAHVQHCPHCKGALLLILTESLQPPAPPDQLLSEAEYEELIPEYLDREKSAGALAAAREYPELWWQLWTNPDLAEQYELTALLMDAQTIGLIDSPPLPSISPQPSQLAPGLRLAREFLHSLFAPQSLLGSAWHGEQEPMLVAEEALPGYRIAIHVVQTTAEHWSLEIEVEPQVTGRMVLSFGETVFRAPLQHGHIAQFTNIPIALLANRAGPDMLISIEQESSA